LDSFTRHSLHALSDTQVVEWTSLALKEQVLAKAAPSEGVWRPFKAEALLAFLRSL
jgi:hypothetical protein